MEKQAGTVGFRGLCEQNPPTPALAVAGVADKYCLAGCSCGSPSAFGAWAEIFLFLAFSCCHATGLRHNPRSGLQLHGVSVWRVQRFWPLRAVFGRCLGPNLSLLGVQLSRRGPVGLAQDTSKISPSCWQPTAVLLPPQSGVCFYNIL